MQTEAPTRRVQRVRHEPKRRELTVLGVERLGASFVDVCFGGEALADFVSEGFDDHVKFMIDAGDGSEPLRRDYTPRRFDRQARTLNIEFALHGDGQASAWAQQAQPGMPAAIAGPRGSMIVPPDYDWHLLAGDATALPAMRRRIEELPVAATVIVLAQLADPADRQLLQDLGPGTARPRLHWAADSEALLAQLRALRLPSGEGFAWAAGEAGAMARLRDVLVRDHAHPAGAMRVSAYWRRGSQGFHEDL